MGMAHLRHRQSVRCARRARRLARARMIMVRILRRILSAEFIGLILILTALQALTSGISSSLRNTDSTYFFWICLLSALIAFGLSKLNWNGIQGALGMIAL